jgi:ASC-1-like (ASCH) protein
MLHRMKLRAKPFEQMQSGEKQYEIRLNDEKRQKLQIGDEIEFSKLPELDEKMVVRVVGLERFNNFEDVFAALQYHYPDWMPQEWVDAMREYYAPDEEEEYGVLAIKIEQA